MVTKILGFVILSLSSVAFAQEITPEAGILDLLKSWPQVGKLLAFVLALQIFLRGLAEALTRISDYTENTYDNKVAAYASQAAWFLGAFVGKVGYGEPKLVTEVKVAKALSSTGTVTLTEEPK